MPTVLLSILVVATALILFFAGTRVWARGAEQPSDQSANPPVVTQPVPAKPAEPNEPLTREEIARKLKELSERPAPSGLKTHGAMCYAPPKTRPETDSYICPRDREVTQYSTAGHEVSFAIRSMNTIRAVANEITGLQRGLVLRVDEIEFCRKCSPNVTDPKLILVVKMPGGEKEHRFRGVTHDDMKLIREFVTGKTVHKGERDSETPLNSHLPRLQELLGVTLAKQGCRVRFIRKSGEPPRGVVFAADGGARDDVRVQP